MREYIVDWRVLAEAMEHGGAEHNGELVRCRDCRQHKESAAGIDYCARLRRTIALDGYCSWAEAVWS